MLRRKEGNPASLKQLGVRSEKDKIYIQLLGG